MACPIDARQAGKALGSAIAARIMVTPGSKADLATARAELARVKLGKSLSANFAHPAD